MILTAYTLTLETLMALGVLLNTLLYEKEIKASSFSLWKYRIVIQYCCSVCYSSWKCWLCGTTSNWPTI